MGTPKDKVKLNVGGKMFETTATTLAGAGRNSFFGAMFDENWNLHSDGEITEHFIDRNPEHFGVLLDLLRTGELDIPPKIDKKLLYREAKYYGILDHARSAKWGPFDGNRARLAQSITGWSASDGEVAQTIRASPSGWCCVTQGSVVRVYDWMLEEHPIIHIEHNKVNDVGWVDSESIVVSSDEKLASGGMGLFNASTGELRYKFQVTDKLRTLAPLVTASTLGFGSDNKLFSSCENADGYPGIGIWDLVTGKLIDFRSLARHHSLRKATRLQWLPDYNCLMALYLYPKVDIALFEFQQNAMCQLLAEDQNKHSSTIRDATVTGESSSICVLGLNECLGFLDFRMTDTSVNWRYKKDSSSGLCFPKLAFHRGELFSNFSSLNDSISVYCGSDWLPTSQLRKSPGGPICDFSIGGDRLFALHKDENVVDVWETPRPAVI